MLNLLPKDCPNTLTPVPLCILDPSLYQLSPLTEGGYLGAMVHSLVDVITLYLGSESDAGLIIRGYFREFPQFLVGRVLRLGSIVHCILVV